MRIRAICWLACLLSTLGTLQNVAAADLLSVGSKAPELNIEHWIHDGGGKFEPVSEFAAGKVYVVEFWATWCGPCVMSMPHLAALQQEYASKGVQIVSVSDEDLETVDQFLERPVRNPPQSEPSADAEAKTTYRQLTSAYCLTTDPDQSTFMDYMEAAVQPGIPTAFIVGKQGTIQWIGHPMEMDEPLAAIVADKWDADRFAAEFKPTQLAQYAEREVSALFQRGDMQGALEFVEKMLAESPSFELKSLKARILLQQGKPEAALKFIDELLAESPSMELKSLKLEVLMQQGDVDGAIEFLDGMLAESPSLELNGFKLQILLSADRTEAAEKHVASLYEQLANQPEQVNSLAWSIFSLSSQGVENLDGIVERSMTAVKAAAEKSDGALKANILDTLAHFHFSRGEVDQAIALETEAVKLAPADEQEYYQNFLQQLTDSQNAPPSTQSE